VLACMHPSHIARGSRGANLGDVGDTAADSVAGNSQTGTWLSGRDREIESQSFAFG